MARRSDHSREELAALVLEAARKIVSEEGTEAVTMRRMAAMIGYAPGSIYNAVGDLEAVLRQVNARTLGDLAEQLEAIMAAPEADTTANAIAIAESYIDFVTRNPRLWAALLERPPQPGEPVPDSYMRPRARLVDIVATSIAPLFPETVVRQRAVIALWAALQGVASLALGGNYHFIAGKLEPQEIARSIVKRYLTGSE